MKRNIIFVSFILFIGLFASINAYAATDKKSDKKKSSAPIVDASNILTVKSSSRSNSVTIGGTVIPGKLVTLNAEVPGRVNYIAGDVGDSFDSDSLLVQLDDTELRARNEEAVAQVHIAEANLRNTEVQYERALASPDYNPMMGNWSTMFNKFNMDSLMGKGDRKMERYSNVYSYKSQYEQARSALRQAESRLRQLDSKIRDSKTIAPFSGVIIKNNIEEGDTVMPGQPLLEFADLEQLQMAIDVPTRVLKGLREGMLLSAKLEHRMIDVQIDKIYPIADAYKHTIKVELNLPINIYAAPGMYAEVIVPDSRSKNSPDYPVIPKSAIIWRGTLPAVYKVNADDEPELRLIRIGERTKGNNIEVLSGVSVGDRVIVAPKVRGWSKNDDEGKFSDDEKDKK